MNYLLAFGLFLFSLIVGHFTFTSLHDTDLQKRTLASLKTEYDLSCLSGEDFQQAVKSRLIKGLESVRQGGNLGFQLGHFIFLDPSADRSEQCDLQGNRSVSSYRTQDKKLACREYPNLSFQFTADDEAVSGHKRELIVEANCEVSDDLAHTDMVWIPWEQLAQETPFEGDTQYSKPSKVSVKTKYISDQWPKKWILEKVELSGKSGQLSVSASEIREIAGRPLVFEFTSPAVPK